MFKSATLRLTLAYLAIVMLVSLFFSLTLYRGATLSLEAGLRRQARLLRPRLPDFADPIGLDRALLAQLAEGRRHILWDLGRTNLVILLLGGGGSYLLARWTLKPIEAALDAQSRFSADASHELRTPLTAMQTEIEVALRDRDLKLPEAKELLESNLEEVAKLRMLADGLLTLSRHQNGESVAMTTISLSGVVDQAIERLGRIVDQTKTRIERTGADQTIKGDSESLISLVTILIDNAIKYSPKDPWIEIKLGRAKRQTVIRVADHGIGIKASELPYIFNRFYRADSSRSKDTAGYGLGLSIARQIADLHRGTITAQSNPGKGSVFTVKLPQNMGAKII